jgi:hypothetical protein
VLGCAALRLTTRRRQVVIVDDRDVWGGSANLLTCEPYHFFYGMHEVNNASWKPEDGDGDEAAALVADDSEMDAGLARVRRCLGRRCAGSILTLPSSCVSANGRQISALLKKVHREFFYPAHTKYTLEQQLSGSGGDVKEILREVRVAGRAAKALTHAHARAGGRSKNPS